MTTMSRREFARRAGALAALPLIGSTVLPRDEKLRFGLVTYLWGRDWDLETLIANCEKTDVLAVELRTEHAHGVEPHLTEVERIAVRERFEDSPVNVLGPGSNEQFHDVDRAKVDRAIANTKRFVELSRDIGGSGVKVKPNGFPKDVERDQTIEQIGMALRECGVFAKEHGQEIRVEVHGRGTQQLPVMRKIMEVADHDAVKVCWNCNSQDLDGEGLAHNFESVRAWFGQTVHVRELDVGEYPYQQLIDRFVGSGYDGWICLEARTAPEDRVAALAAQRALFATMVADARERARKNEKKGETGKRRRV